MCDMNIYKIYFKKTREWVENSIKYKLENLVICTNVKYNLSVPHSIYRCVCMFHWQHFTDMYTYMYVYMNTLCVCVCVCVCTLGEKFIGWSKYSHGMWPNNKVYFSI